MLCVIGAEKKGTKTKEEKETKKTSEPGSISEPGAHQALAVLGIAIIAMGEEIGAEMALRTFNHLVSIYSLQQCMCVLYSYDMVNQ